MRQSHYTLQNVVVAIVSKVLRADSDIQMLEFCQIFKSFSYHSPSLRFDIIEVEVKR